MLGGLAFLVGFVFIVIWAVQRAGGGPDDESLRTLRTRFARGEIDAAAFEEMRRVLGSAEHSRARDRVGLIGLLLLVGALLAWIVGPSLWPSGSGWDWRSMMGPNGMRDQMIDWMTGPGAGPTAGA